jgi:Pyridine nucleotide-disulphide oxidoreductase
METIDTVVIGAGHVGLAVSRCLTAAGRDHVVLDRGRLAESWRSSRWDSLRLLTPNWMTWLPGWRYQGADSEGFMTIAELTGYLDDYARSFDSPVQTWTGVTDVSAAADGYRVVTTQDDWFAGNVVMASGAHPHRFIDSTGLAGEVLTKPAIAPVSVSRQVNAMDVRAAGVSTVVWATGLRHEYPWLHVPVFDRTATCGNTGVSRRLLASTSSASGSCTGATPASSTAPATTPGRFASTSRRRIGRAASDHGFR